MGNAGQVTRIDYGNGTAVIRGYDDADRPTLIRYQDAAGNALLSQVYEYTPDGLVRRIIETDEVSEPTVTGPIIADEPGTVSEFIPPLISQVNFEYDNRNRLTRESRTVTGPAFDTDLGPAEYDLSYTYDAGGNRLSKTDNHSARVTTYHYDIETPDNLDGGQHNNRLLSIDVEDTDLATGTMNLVEQTIYRYGPAGNVTRLIKRFDSDGFGGLNDDDFFADVWWFYYDTGNRLWLAVRGTGDYDAVAAVLVPGSTLFNTAAVIILNNLSSITPPAADNTGGLPRRGPSSASGATHGSLEMGIPASRITRSYSWISESPSEPTLSAAWFRSERLAS